MSWRNDSDGMRQALRDAVMPALRDDGFRGSFPHLHRLRDTHIDYLDFQFSMYGPNLYIEIASVPAMSSTLTESRPPSKRRIEAGFYFRRIGPMLGINFEGAASPEKAKALAESILQTINVEGTPWWLNPSPAVVLPNPSLERP